MDRQPVLPVPELSDIEPSPLVSDCESHSRNQIQQTDESGFPYMTPKELSELITDHISKDIDNLVILDARFDYEFRGGRIIGAKNILSTAQLIGVYHRYLNTKTVIVFYCEFSQTRSPCLIKQFRAYDRSKHTHPDIAYPNIYLLQGGYKRFYAEYPNFTTGGYIKMRDKEYVNNGQLKRAFTLFKRDVENSSSFSLQTRRRRSSVADSYHSFSYQNRMDLEISNLTLSASQGN